MSTLLIDNYDSYTYNVFHLLAAVSGEEPIVVRNDVLIAEPELPAALFAAFDAAKQNYLGRIDSGEASANEDRRYQRLRQLVGDPLPYGLAENATSLAALVRYTHEQGLITGPWPISSVFPDQRVVPSPVRMRVRISSRAFTARLLHRAPTSPGMTRRGSVAGRGYAATRSARGSASAGGYCSPSCAG